MLEDIAGAYGSRFFLAAGGVGLALLCLIAVLWLVRKRAPSPFVRGGKNRQPRLQVLDAAAVDARRRLVLVRRDGVEHLIMIGGPTDIVIESGISDPSKPGGAAVLPSLQAITFAEPAVALPAPQAEPVAIKQPVAAIAAAANVEKIPAPQIEARQEVEAAARRAAAEQQSQALQELFEPAAPAAVSQQKPRIEPAPVVEPVVAQRPAAPAASVTPLPAVEADRPQAPAPFQPAPAFSQPAAALSQPTRVAPLSESSVAEILDAARSKIMPQPIEHQKPISPPQQAIPMAAVQAANTGPREEPRPMIPAAPVAAAVAPAVVPVTAAVVPVASAAAPIEAAAAPVTVVAEPVAAAPAVAPPLRAEPRELGGDFQSFLEAEMSNNLAAERIVPNTPPAQRPAQPAPAVQAVPGQRRDPEMARITGADSALQTEVARIFGEMSVNRDK